MHASIASGKTTPGLTPHRGADAIPTLAGAGSAGFRAAVAREDAYAVALLVTWRAFSALGAAGAVNAALGALVLNRSTAACIHKEVLQPRGGAWSCEMQAKTVCAREKMLASNPFTSAAWTQCP